MNSEDKLPILSGQEYLNLKQELEIKKINQEIQLLENNNKEISKEWYKKPQWISAIVPLLIGLCTLIIVWANGFLQAQSTLNRIQETQFTQKKDSIEKYIAQLSSNVDSLSNLSDSLNKVNLSLTTNRDSLAAKLASIAANEYNSTVNTQMLGATNISEELLYRIFLQALLSPNTDTSKNGKGK